jgi:Cd2+/Zn2+-exporting ATPase/Cu+-exporting ATPase
MSLPGDLSSDERRRISARLGAGLVGVALLALGTLLIYVAPGQWQLGELMRAAAALAVGTPVLLSGVAGVVTGDTRRATDQLVALAVLAAAASGEFVTATLVPLCLELGRIFEERSSLGARAAIDGIRALAARRAVRWHDGVEEAVDPGTLQPGDQIIVRPGERIAVDGTVLSGSAAVDQSAITGESRHEDVGPGSPVFAGSVALDGLLYVQVRGTGNDTVLGRVVQLLTQVEQTSVPVLRLFERRAGVWLPLVLTIAATVLFFTEDLSRAIAVLVVSTPTALVVAGPAVMVATMTAAARLRILIKSSDFVERITTVDTLILDKTGTVTVGAPQVIDVQPAEGVTATELLATAASCGFGSLHPVSRAVVAAARAEGLAVEQPDEVEERPGLGVVARIGGERAALGRPALLQAEGLTIEPGGDDVSDVWAARRGRLLGRLLLRDEPRAEARDALQAMRAIGITHLMLLTGDRQAIAAEIGQRLGMDEVIAEVLPEAKLEVVRRQQQAGRTVMMVGDGVNDALALSGADVGVAVGAEINEVALGGADVALLGADLSRLPRLVQLADRAHQVIGQNVWLAFGLAGVLIVLAAVGALNPLEGALAQSLAVLAVVINSARLVRVAAPASLPPQKGSLDKPETGDAGHPSADPGAHAGLPGELAEAGEGH